MISPSTATTSKNARTDRTKASNVISSDVASSAADTAGLPIPAVEAVTNGRTARASGLQTACGHHAEHRSHDRVQVASPTPTASSGSQALRPAAPDSPNAARMPPIVLVTGSMEASNHSGAEDPGLLLLELSLGERSGVPELGQPLQLGHRVGAG